MIRTLTLAAAAATLSLPVLACDGFEVHDSYARAAGMMAQSGAAFMVLRNTGDADCHIVAVRSDIGERTELHTHREDDQGVMRMVELEDGIDLPAGSDHLMARGGDHVMFLGLSRPMAQGEPVEVTFVFDDGAEHSVSVKIDNERQPEGHGHSQGHQHGHQHGTRN